MREDTIHSHLGHVQIVRPGYLDSGVADPFSYLLAEQSPDQRRLEKLPRVRAVAPRLSFSGLVSRGESTLSFIADGVDPHMEASLSRTLLITDGQGLASADPHGIIVGQGLAATLGLKPGDKVVMLANTGAGGVNGVEARVRGLFSTPVKAYDDVALRAPLGLAQDLVRTKGAHRWIVLLEDTSDTDQVVSRIREEFSGQAYQVVPWYELADFYNKTVMLFSRQVTMVKLMITLIILLSISNTLIMVVLERTAEIGTMMALGSTRASIMRLFVTEGALLGIIGGLSGCIIGVLLAHLISAIGIPMPPPPGMARGFTGGIMVDWHLAADAVMLAIIATVFASFYPAWKASRMVVVDALRYSR
jgi:putative ABC transport system permease protein